MRIERLEREYRVDTRLVFFPLHPDTPPEGLTLEQLFPGRDPQEIRAGQDRLRKLAAREGLPYGERTMTYDSRLAQELGAWADSRGEGSRLHDALFRAYFADGVNFAQVDRLLEIAGAAGLPTDEARDVIENRRFRAEVDAHWRRSRELGISGVPTFLLGERRLVGAHPYEALEDLVRSAGAGGHSGP